MKALNTVIYINFLLKDLLMDRHVKKKIISIKLSLYDSFLQFFA